MGRQDARQKKIRRRDKGQKKWGDKMETKKMGRQDARKKTARRDARQKKNGEM